MYQEFMDNLAASLRAWQNSSHGQLESLRSALTDALAQVKNSNGQLAASQTRLKAVERALTELQKQSATTFSLLRAEMGAIQSQVATNSAEHETMRASFDRLVRAFEASRRPK